MLAMCSYVLLPAVRRCCSRFLPPYCAEHKVVRLDNDEVVQQAAPVKERELDLATWQIAWDSYALAAAALEQLSFHASMLHKKVVLQIACHAAAEKRSSLLGVIYDRMVRCVSHHLSSQSIRYSYRCLVTLRPGVIGRTCRPSWAVVFLSMM